MKDFYDFAVWCRLLGDARWRRVVKLFQKQTNRSRVGSVHPCDSHLHRDTVERRDVYYRPGDLTSSTTWPQVAPSRSRDRRPQTHWCPRSTTTAPVSVWTWARNSDWGENQI